MTYLFVPGRYTPHAFQILKFNDAFTLRRGQEFNCGEQARPESLPAQDTVAPHPHCLLAALRSRPQSVPSVLPLHPGLGEAALSGPVERGSAVRSGGARVAPVFPCVSGALPDSSRSRWFSPEVNPLQRWKRLVEMSLKPPIRRAVS